MEQRTEPVWPYRRNRPDSPLLARGRLPLALSRDALGAR
jgi:hypothetical protein